MNANRMILVLISMSLLVPVFSGNAKSIPLVESCTLPGDPNTDNVKLVEDVVYNTVDGEELLLDIARPIKQLNTKSYPTVIVFHGGGFVVGDKATGGGTAQRRAIMQLAEHGFVAVSANYRLTTNPDNAFPAAVQDARCVIRWARAHADDYGIDVDNIAITGVSAGGGLASSLAVMNDETSLQGNSIDDVGDYHCAADEEAGTKFSSEVQKAALYYAPSDFTVPLSDWGETAPLIVNYIDGNPQKKAKRAHNASPISYVHKKLPPILLLHGTDDDTVPYQQSKRMVKKLRNYNIATRLVSVSGVGHSFMMFDPDYYSSVTDEQLVQLSECTGKELSGQQCIVNNGESSLVKTVDVLVTSSCTAWQFFTAMKQ